MSTATLTHHRDSLADARAALVEAGYKIRVFPETPGACIARLNRNGFHATVVLCHDHVHQCVLLSRETTEGVLKTVLAKFGDHINHEYVELDVTGAVHVAQKIAVDIAHAARTGAQR